jgi:hypothetical protein
MPLPSRQSSSHSAPKMAVVEIQPRASQLSQDLRGRHRLQDVRIIQLHDGIPGVVIRADGRPARIEDDQLV